MASFPDSIYGFIGWTPAVTLYITVLCLIFLTLRALYNVFFHPLSTFPGPRFSAASDLPYVVALVQGKLPQWISAVHAAYQSPIVRISPNELSFIDAGAWEGIYGRLHADDAFERDVLIYGKPLNGVHSLLTAPKDDHARMRRVLNHAFSDKAYRDQEPPVLEHIDHLMKRLREHAVGPESGEVDVVKWYNWTSFDVIGDLSFGQSFDCLEKKQYHPWVEMIFGNLKGIALMSACNRFVVLRNLMPFLIPRRITRMIQDHWAATTENVDRRLKLGTDRPDFFSPIIKNMDETKGTLKHEELMSNASLFIIAGSESIATVLSGTTYYLLQNPKVMKALTQEILSSFKSEKEITPQHVSQLPYLNACLFETNRLYPTALTGQAMRAPAEGKNVCGRWIPGTTGVSINQFAAYTSPTNFCDPHKYAPERWLDDPRYSSDKKSVFQPFSVGARNCIGKSLGNLETRMILARMIWNFDIQFCTKTDRAWDDQQVYLSWQKKPLFVKLQLR